MISARRTLYACWVAWQLVSSPEGLGAQRTQLASLDSAGAARRAGGDLLSRVIAVRLHDVTVERALRAIAAQADVRLSYSSDLFPPQVRVSLVRERISLGDALDEALRETDLDVAVTPSGYLIVVRSPWPRVAQERRGSVPDSVPRLAARGARTQVMDRVLVMGTPVAGTAERSLTSAVTVMTGAQLTQMGVRTLGQIFRNSIPGIVAWDLGVSGPFAQVGSVRGSSSFSANYLKTYVDGVELASPYLLFAIDPYSIERIEIIRGPQGSAMYGSDAISGVVQVITRKGSPASRWRPVFDATGAIGRQESRYTPSPSATQRYSAMASTGGGMTSAGFGGTFEDVGAVVPGASAGYRGTFGGFRTVLGSLRLDATARYADIRFTAPENPLFRTSSASELADVNALLEPQRLENETYGVTADHQATEHLRHTLVVGIDRHAGAIPPQREPATVADALLGATQERVDKRSLRYSASGRFTLFGESELTATAGFERAWFRRQRLGFTSKVVGAGTGLTSLYDDDVLNTGVFGQLRLGLPHSVFVTAGLRGERNSSFGADFGTAYSPMLGAALTQDVGEATVKVRAAFGKGIRPPQPSMRRAIRTVGYRQLENPLLEPEAQNGVEGGLEVYLRDRLSLSLTAYRQDANGLIQQVIANPLVNARTIQYQNVGRIHNQGVEVEASARAGTLRADLSYAFTESRVRALSNTYTGDLSIGDRVPEVPARAGMFSLTYDHRRLRALAGVHHLGPWTGYDWLTYYRLGGSATDSRPLLRNYWTRYAGLTKPFAGAGYAVASGVEAFVRVDNLTNLQRNERDDLQITAGRTTSFGLRLVR